MQNNKGRNRGKSKPNRIHSYGGVQQVPHGRSFVLQKDFHFLNLNLLHEDEDPSPFAFAHIGASAAFRNIFLVFW